MKKLIDAAGAGASFTSPGWLTQLGRLWGGKSVRRVLALLSTLCECEQQLYGLQIRLTPYTRSLPLQDVPVADAKPADIQDLLGGALFKALYKWMEETGPVYLLPTGALVLPPMRPLHLSQNIQASDEPSL